MESDNKSNSSSSALVPAPLTFEMIQTLFSSHQMQQNQRFEQLQADAAAERAAAATAAAATAATVEGLTLSVALLQAQLVKLSVQVPLVPSAVPPASIALPAHPDPVRSAAILGADAAAIQSLISRLASTSEVGSKHTTTASSFDVEDPGLSSTTSNSFDLLDDLSHSQPGQPSHLIHALTSALTDGSKAAKRFKTVQEFSKALNAQHAALISAGSSTAVLAAWYKYTVFLLDLNF
ncbi:MAG: hypothetical protein JWL77_7110 [Chthonomonadaceae bacterium]|nr:hypothetical protein [Chthonomonadaceae bacterium]